MSNVPDHPEGVIWDGLVANINQVDDQLVVPPQRTIVNVRNTLQVSECQIFNLATWVLNL